MQEDVFGIKSNGRSLNIYLTVQKKHNVLFAFFLWGWGIIDFKNCFISAVLPCSYKDLDCTVPS